MAFNFLKKRDGDAPPDVGQEEVYDQSHGDNEFGSTGGISVQPLSAPPSTVSPGPIGPPGQPSAMSAIEMEKLNARIDSIIEWIKQFYERFSYLSESIGSVRTMALNNEKEISKMVTETTKAVDMVNELEPDKLMVNYQKINLRITEVSERVESIKQIHETLMNEIQELKRRADIFIGIDGLLKLNEEVKKDLIETKKLSSTVRVNSDKAEQIFLEIRRGFEESQKSMESVNNLEANYSIFRKEFEKMKLEASNAIRQKEFLDLKNAVENLKSVNSRVDRIGGVVEKSLTLAKKNEEDIADVALTIGKENIKKVSDYENQLASVLEIMASFAAQLRELKSKKEKVESAKPSKPSKNKKDDVSELEKMTGLEKGVVNNEQAIVSLRQKLNMAEDNLKQKIKENEETEEEKGEETTDEAGEDKTNEESEEKETVKFEDKLKD